MRVRDAGVEVRAVADLLRRVGDGVRNVQMLAARDDVVIPKVCNSLFKVQCIRPPVD